MLRDSRTAQRAPRLAALGPAALMVCALASSTGAQTTSTLSLRDLTLAQPTGELILGHDVDFEVTGNPAELAVLFASTTPPIPGLIFLGAPIEFDIPSYAVPLSGVVDPLGTAHLTATLPSGAAVGVTAYAQALVANVITFDMRLTNGLAVQTASEPFAVLEQGSQSAHPVAASTQGGAVLIADHASWKSFWALHAAFSLPPPPPPAVDFSQDAVVAVFAGWRSSSGYWIDVDRIVYTGATLEVDTTEQQPGAGCGVLWVITYPYQFVTVPQKLVATLQHNPTVVVYGCD